MAVNKVTKNSENIRLVFSAIGSEPNDFEMGYTQNLIDNIGKDKYNITAYPIEGFEFVSLKGVASPDKETIVFTVSEDGLSATYEGFEFDGKWTYSLKFNDSDIVLREAEKPKPVYLGFNHVYSMTPQQLIDFTKERFTGGSMENPIDLGQYVINILELPFLLSENFFGSSINITVGNVTMITQGTEVLTDEIILNVGEITVTSVFKNGYDYTNTNAYLHLPFSSTVELPLEYVIDEKVTVQYVINLYDGSTTLILRSSKINDSIFHSSNFKLGRNIPFVKNYGSQDIIGSQQNVTPINNSLFTAFIEIIRNKPYDIENPYQDNTMERTYLKELSGFVSVDNIELHTVATLKEQEYIKSILKEGVLIK